MRHGSWCSQGVLLALLALAPRPAAAAPPIVPPPRRLDISGVLEHLVVFTDHKGHYFASRVQPVNPVEAKNDIYYGDGKVFYRQHVPSVGGTREYYSASIVDPRVLFANMSNYLVREGQATFTCDDRSTKLTPLPLDKGQALLKKAKLYDTYWTRSPHALARDDEGRYYYVDRLRSADKSLLGLRGFRIFVGERGKMKPLKMKNMVSDVRGEVFITHKGRLRLILTRDDDASSAKAKWLEGKTRQTDLVVVPVEDPRTRVMIFRELGVYQGLRLHKPCDDL